MGRSKKKSIQGLSSSNSKPSTFDKNRELKNRGSIKQIRTWDDIEHDSEDEYFEEKDKLFLEDKDSNTVDVQDSEVFAIDDDDYDSQDSNVDEYYEQDNSDAFDDYEDLSDISLPKDDLNNVDSEDSDTGAWGSKKTDYYNNDEILASSDEEAAEMDEEEEALKLQKKFLSQLSANDFLTDLSIAKKSKSVYSEIASKSQDFGFGFEDDLQDSSANVFSVGTKSTTKISIAPSLDGKSVSKENKLKILAKSNPELTGLLSDLSQSYQASSDLSILIEKAYKFMDKKRRKKSNEFAFVQALYQLHLLYISNISFYLMVLSSPESERIAIDDLQKHKVFGVLSRINTLFDKFNQYESKVILNLENEILASTKELKNTSEVAQTYVKKTKKAKKTKSSKSQPSKDISNKPILPIFTKPSQNELNSNEYSELSTSIKKSKKSKATTDYDNDFGELRNLDQVDFDDKNEINRKKMSLRHFASKISSSKKKNKDKRAKLDGDVDIPYKSKSKKVEDLSNSNYGDELEQQTLIPSMVKRKTDDSDDVIGNDYYEQVKKQSKTAKEAKISRKQEGKASKNVGWKQVLEENLENEAYIEDTSEKRPINYQILKNKGLTPKRNKINRNPRVKKKVKYASAKKKLSSTRQVYKQPTTAYAGEATGIKSNLSKSVKLG
ncbi:hypothetical protein AYI70_g12066 [Smittium culicis]|uniref:Sas10 C-terminal domain-containing protein n=1 Tax=Smittium culicis TaxID=133412 RepID=A0A1R1WZ03_9FUNG|nr:hypothetical protein AYI70_g12066 [Smittium culicis]